MKTMRVQTKDLKRSRIYSNDLIDFVLKDKGKNYDKAMRQFYSFQDFEKLKNIEIILYPKICLQVVQIRNSLR